MHSESFDTVFSGIVLALIAALTFGTLVQYTPWV
jgi:hypothetical protein